MRLEMARNSACACIAETPGFSRPITLRYQQSALEMHRGFSSCRCRLSGTHTSGAVPTSLPKNPAGITPTIVTGTPLSTIDCPIADPLRPYRHAQ